MTKPSIGVVGLGRMGANMARRLHDCGYPVKGLFDVSSALAETLAEELGLTSSPSLADVTRNCDVVITVVPDDKAMEVIYFSSEDNLLMHARGTLFINCATITPEVHVAVKAKADEIGADVLECPMASSIPQARNGTLYLMCAGDYSVYEKALPVLQSLASQTVYTGEAGTAAQLKALVNMVMNINTAALAEGLGLASALGFDLNLVRQVFSQTGANSRVLETDGEDMQNRDHETYFSAAHAAKDSGIALALGEAAGLPMALARSTKRMYDEMVRCGLGDLDKSGVSELTFKERQPEMCQL